MGRRVQAGTRGARGRKYPPGKKRWGGGHKPPHRAGPQAWEQVSLPRVRGGRREPGPDRLPPPRSLPLPPSGFRVNGVRHAPLGPPRGADSRVPVRASRFQTSRVLPAVSRLGSRLGNRARCVPGAPPARRGPRRPKQAPIPSFRHGLLLWAPGSPRKLGPDPRIAFPKTQTHFRRAPPGLPAEPSGSHRLGGRPARLGPHPQTGAAASRHPHPLRPSITCPGLGASSTSSSADAARASQLRRDAGALGLFPLPPGPGSDHVTLLRPPCPNFRTLRDAARAKPSVGNRSEPEPCGGPRRLQVAPRPSRSARRPLRTAGPQLPGAATLSMSRSPALLLLLRAPLDRIGQQCGACHWPGEADATLIGRARARGAPHSTVSERFETPKAPPSASGGRGGGAPGKGWKKKGGEEERCKYRDKSFPCARERVNCA